MVILLMLAAMVTGAAQLPPPSGQAEPAPEIALQPTMPGHVLLPGHKISGPAPTYPSKAKEQRLQGRVILKATVTRTGDVVNILVETSPGNALSEAAVSALRKWKFFPWTRDGIPIDWEVHLPVRFELVE